MIFGTVLLWTAKLSEVSMSEALEELLPSMILFSKNLFLFGGDHVLSDFLFPLDKGKGVRFLMGGIGGRPGSSVREIFIKKSLMDGC